LFICFRCTWCRTKRYVEKIVVLFNLILFDIGRGRGRGGRGRGRGGGGGGGGGREGGGGGGGGGFGNRGR
jgi:hypothetical protein